MELAVARWRSLRGATANGQEALPQATRTSTSRLPELVFETQELIAAFVGFSSNVAVRREAPDATRNRTVYGNLIIHTDAGGPFLAVPAMKRA